MSCGVNGRGGPRGIGCGERRGYTWWEDFFAEEEFLGVDCVAALCSGHVLIDLQKITNLVGLHRA